MINIKNIGEASQAVHDVVPDQFLEEKIRLWEVLATELADIIGEGGFQSLFSRSVFLSIAVFPWLEKFQLPLPGESRFVHFKACCEGREIVEIRDANDLILSAFVETLSSLIGDGLTAYILRPAWAHNRTVNTAGANLH